MFIQTFRHILDDVLQQRLKILNHYRKKYSAPERKLAWWQKTKGRNKQNFKHSLSRDFNVKTTLLCIILKNGAHGKCSGLETSSEMPSARGNQGRVIYLFSTVLAMTRVRASMIRNIQGSSPRANHHLSPCMCITLFSLHNFLQK